MKDRYIRVLSKIPALSDAAQYAGDDAKDDIFSLITARVTAPVLFCYVLFILRQAQKLGLKRIYFLARDGYILRLIANEICEKNNIDIDIRYLYCSRYSLKNALYYLCDTPEKAEESGIFGRCARQSAANTLLRAGFDQNTREAIYKDIGYSGDEEKHMDNREFEGFCAKLKQSELFLRLLKENARDKYDMILRYFEQEGLFEDVPYALADTGWLGSIQSAFEKLSEGRRAVKNVVGFYFGMFKNVSGEHYRTFLFSGEDAHKTVPRFCNNLFECFCSAPHGMTVGYYEENGVIKPSLSPERPSSAALANIQCDTAVRFAKSAAAHISEIDEELSRKVCRELLSRLMYKPTYDEARALSAFTFCDDATEKDLEPIAEPCDKDSLKSLLFIRRMLNRAKGASIYPDKGLYWLYGTIALSDIKCKAIYRYSVRMWEKLRLLREKRSVCR